MHWFFCDLCHMRYSPESVHKYEDGYVCMDCFDAAIKEYKKKNVCL